MDVFCTSIIQVPTLQWKPNNPKPAKPMSKLFWWVKSSLWIPRNTNTWCRWKWNLSQNSGQIRISKILRLAQTLINFHQFWIRVLVGHQDQLISWNKFEPSFTFLKNMNETGSIFSNFGSENNNNIWTTITIYSNVHWCFLSRRICLNQLVGMMAKVAMPFMGWPSCCLLRSHLLGQWVTILNSRVGLAVRNGHLHINLYKFRWWLLQKFTHLTWLSNRLKPILSLLGKIFPRKKGTSKTLANLQSCIIFDFPFTLLQRKLDLEGPIIVFHGQAQSNETHASFGKRI